ncbi:MAG: DUF3866 family protein [Clostridiales bacterium]|nr:DUF3866 family protein [Clostridiales bacterium]
MIRIRKGIVMDIIYEDDSIALARVCYDGTIHKAVNYNLLSGRINKGDVVYINTTAGYLHLGTGGYDFIIINESSRKIIEITEPGHIMKLRYTPYQVNCMCTSEQQSKYHEMIKGFKSLDNMIVISGELHSMLAPAACTLKFLNSDMRIIYIMTDGGCLEAGFSHTVRELKDKKIISYAVTYGNALGGDAEAVNIFDALAIAKEVFHGDAAIVTMGPGSVGTGTKYGFSGIEQGSIIDCVNKLNGISVFIPRISFKDKRKRHFGISHHTITVLKDVCCTSAHVVFPILEQEYMEYILSQIKDAELCRYHLIEYIKSDIVFDALKFYNMNPTTMGRSIKEDKEFFMSCGAAPVFASYLLNLS